MLRLCARFSLTLLVLLVTAGSAHAQRKGFIIGGGLGPGLTTGDVDTKVGTTANFKIGAMVGQSVQLYFDNRANGSSSDVADFESSGLAGLGLTYQMENKVRLNAVVGASYMWFSDVDTWFSDVDMEMQFGFGGGAGVGYEFAKHWIVSLDGSYGGSRA